MNNKPNRVARLTSSKASLLTVSGREKYGFGAGALTYIKERIIELEFGRGVNLPVNKWEMSWGKLWEVWVHWQLGNNYKLGIDETTIHPKYSFWSGSEDFKFSVKKAFGIAELKCYQMKNHYDLTKCLMQEDVESFKKEFPAEYWQIVSNACIHIADFGEAIAFMPTMENLIEMRKLVQDTDYIEKNMQGNPWQYKFIVDRDLWDLPFIPEHSKVPSMVKFRFEIPLKDKVYLTERFIKADILLNEML